MHRKFLRPAAVACVIAVTGGLSTGAHGAAAPAVHAQPIQVSPVAASALGTISAANTGFGLCNTGPEVPVQGRVPHVERQLNRNRVRLPPRRPYLKQPGRSELHLIDVHEGGDS